jgi:hypothetical protein
LISVFCSHRYANRSGGHIGGWKDTPCWAKIIPYDQPYCIYTDIEQYRQSTANIKIAFDLIDWGLDSTCITGPQVVVREKNKVHDLTNISDLTFIIETEVHAPTLMEHEDFKQIDNLYWILAGTVESHSDKIIPWQYHIWRIAELYRELTEPLGKLDPYAVKPQYFDAMLGTRKPPREFVADQIVANNLADKIVYALGPPPGEDLDSPLTQNSKFIWEPDFEPVPGMDYLKLNQQMRYHGLTVQMPCVMPIQLFNNTAYSIVCETGFTNYTHMLSEKTAKALIGRRLFVMFAGAGILKFIRSEGFKTFNEIIDETYDTIEDDVQRWTAAFEQVKQLCSMDQKEVLERVRPIVKHNYQHAMIHDLQTTPIMSINNKIQTLLKKKSNV